MSMEAIYFLHCHSPLHNGAGTGQVGLIDRPVIRERITGLPFHQASGIKGSLRDAIGIDEPNKKRVIFGDDTPGGSTNNGYLDFDDAGLLAFPVRSLKGGLAWATSLLLLTRFERAARAISSDILPTVIALLQAARTLTDGMVGVIPQGVAELGVTIDGATYIYLEEYRMAVTPELNEGPLARFASFIADTAIGPRIEADAMAILLSGRLLLVHDDLLLYFARHATEVQANIQIDDGTAITKKGSLRYTEYLPSESILFGRITAQEPGFGAATGASIRAIYSDDVAMLNDFQTEASGRVFTFGADRSTGKGRCRFSLLRAVPQAGGNGAVASREGNL